MIQKENMMLIIIIIFMKSNGAIEFMYDGNGLSWKRKEWFKLHPHLIDDDE